MANRELHNVECGFGNLKNFVEISLDNLFYRPSSDENSPYCATSEIAVISFRHLVVFNIQQFSQFRVREFIWAQNHSVRVLNELYIYLKAKNLQPVALKQSLIKQSGNQKGKY